MHNYPVISVQLSVSQNYCPSIRDSLYSTSPRWSMFTFAVGLKLSQYAVLYKFDPPLKMKQISLECYFLYFPFFPKYCFPCSYHILVALYFLLRRSIVCLANNYNQSVHISLQSEIACGFK